jgi:hypothetical protein
MSDARKRQRIPRATATPKRGKRDTAQAATSEATLGDYLDRAHDAYESGSNDTIRVTCSTQGVHVESGGAWVEARVWVPKGES